MSPGRQGEGSEIEGKRKGRTVLRKNGNQKQDVLLARAGLYSFTGLHKVDDRNVLC